MSSIYVFCDRHQLRDWLVEFADKKELRIVSFGDGPVGELTSVDDFELREDIFRVFLLSRFAHIDGALALNDIRPRQWGWIDVRPGGVRKSNSKSVLLYSEIHGEKCERDQCHPDKLVQWLKKRMKTQVHTGVVGRNIVHGGESVYNDISYTDKAKELFDLGVIWKQFMDANSVFQPLNN